MTEHIPAEVYVELGAAGLTLPEIRGLIRQASDLSSAKHQMGAEGRIPVPHTTRVLVYNGGIDGWDWRVYLEDNPASTGSDDVHVDWHMTRDEWRQLSTALREQAWKTPYIVRLITAGKVPPP